MTEVPCPGSCNSRYREAQEAYKQALLVHDPLDPHQERPDPPDIKPWYGSPVWCGPCTAKISQRLGQLEYAIGIYHAFADGYRDAPDAPMVAGSTEAMSPSDAADTADELGNFLTEWEAAYREKMRWRAAYYSGDLATRTTECYGWLAERLPGILRSPMAEDFGKEVLAKHHEISSKAKLGRRTLTKPMRCPTPSCQQLTLTWVEGEDQVYCSNPDCRRVMSYAEYESEVAGRTGGAAA